MKIDLQCDWRPYLLWVGGVDPPRSCRAWIYNSKRERPFRHRVYDSSIWYWCTLKCKQAQKAGGIQCCPHHLPICCWEARWRINATCSISFFFPFSSRPGKETEAKWPQFSRVSECDSLVMMNLQVKQAMNVSQIDGTLENLRSVFLEKC